MSNKGTYGFPKKQYISSSDSNLNLSILNVTSTTDLKIGDVVVNDQGIIRNHMFSGYIPPSVINCATISSFIAITASTCCSMVLMPDGNYCYMLYSTNTVIITIRDLSGNILFSNSSSIVDGAGTATLAQLAVLTNGNIVVVYQSSTSTYVPKYAIFNNQLVLQGSVTTVESGTWVASSAKVSVAALSDGGFIITYLAASTLYPKYGKYNASGVLQGSLIQISASSASLVNPTVCAVGSGGFAIAYRETSNGNPKLGVYTSAAELIGGAYTTVEAINSSNYYLALCTTGDFGFVLCYLSAVSTVKFGRYTTTGTLVGSVVTTTVGMLYGGIAYSNLLREIAIVSTSSNGISSYARYSRYNIDTGILKNFVVTSSTANYTSNNTPVIYLNNCELVVLIPNSTTPNTVCYRINTNTAVILGIAASNTNIGGDINIKYIGDNGVTARILLNSDWGNNVLSYDHRSYGGSYGFFLGKYAYLKGI